MSLEEFNCADAQALFQVVGWREVLCQIGGVDWVLEELEVVFGFDRCNHCKLALWVIPVLIVELFIPLFRGVVQA